MFANESTAVSQLSIDSFPTRDQILSFMDHVSDEHSWYKRLPRRDKHEDPLKKTSKGYKFKFYISKPELFAGSSEDENEFGSLSYTIESQKNYDDIEGIELRFNDQSIYFFLTTYSYDQNERMEQSKNCQRIADAIEENLRKTYLSFKNAQSDVENRSENLNTIQNYLGEELKKSVKPSKDPDISIPSYLTDILKQPTLYIPSNTVIVSTAILIILSGYASNC